MLVVDASTVVAALVDDGPDGRWAADLLAARRLVAPHLMPVEVVSTLRRAVLSGQIDGPVAQRAGDRLHRLDVDLHPLRPYGTRVWELRSSVTPYDAWYVAVAEAMAIPVASLDGRLVRSPGPRCTFLTPDAA